MASVSKMNCVRETFDEVTGEGTYLMTLSNYPIAPPFMNNIIYHDGRPTERLFSCNVSRIDHEEASSPYCRISIIEPFEGLPLYSECSNHGVCDKVVGKCACERGFKGEACNDIRDAEVGGGDEFDGNDDNDDSDDDNNDHNHGDGDDEHDDNDDHDHDGDDDGYEYTHTYIPLSSYRTSRRYYTMDPSSLAPS